MISGNVQPSREGLCQGGWKVHRQRTDKSANAPHVAQNILKTIHGLDLSEHLRSLLEDVKEENFRPVIGKKRKRPDSSADNDSDIDDILH